MFLHISVIARRQQTYLLLLPVALLQVTIDLDKGDRIGLLLGMIITIDLGMVVVVFNLVDEVAEVVVGVVGEIGKLIRLEMMMIQSRRLPPPSAAAPPPITTTTGILPAATIPANYPDSINSSPRSRNTDSLDDPAPPTLHSKIRVMCSYGGTIVPRPHDKCRLSVSILHGRPFTLKYQLPSEDLDSLISVTTDEDFENMIDEYDRTCSQTLSSNKYTRIRLFLFPINPEETQLSWHSMGPILNNSTKSDEWFLNALNGAGLLSRGFSDSATKANCLLGLDDDRQVSVVEVGLKDEGSGSRKNLNLKNHDVQSVPDSPMLETNSSFGSTSSFPSLANVPPTRVHADDQKEHKMAGIEERFAHLTVTAAASGGASKQQDEGLMGSSSVTQAVSGGGVPGENTNLVCSDDERSDHGVPVGYKKSSPPQSLPQGAPLQNQQKSSSGHDLASPDQVQIPSGTNGVPTTPVDPNLDISDPNANARFPLQLVQEPGYMSQQPQFDQQLQQQQQQQLVQDSSYTLQQPHFDHQLQQQQLVQDSSYILQQPQFDQRLQQQQQRVPDCDYIFQQPQFDLQLQQQLVPDSGQGQAYNFHVQQLSTNEGTNAIPSSHSQTPPNLTVNHLRSAPISNPEMAAAARAFGTSATGTPQLVQVPNNQQQYVHYSQIHRSSQSVAPTSAMPAMYAYDFTDPANSQMYSTQHLAPTMPSHFQTMTGATAVVLPDSSAQRSTDNVNQQIKTSRPM
ncbi:Detected protein of unknown function [Hibiscus syriacus]|uniref:PB1 domain-containing protein n=1 Tax=Hibiscus syriacus TaxID=106335 RepID=A0A6A2Y4L7_HIBSY|nr:Detected protein of unknown function [Hibiscus syriacus]